MNLIGKIFTVCVFVMSLVFMAFAITVYATHRNYRGEILRTPTELQSGQEKGLKFQIEDQNNRLKNLQAQKAAIETELAKEKVARQQMVAMLEAEMVDAKLRRDALIALQQKQAADTAVAVGEMNKTQSSIDALRAQIETLRADIKTTTDDRDASLAKVLGLEDQLAQAIGEWDRLRKRNEELTKDVSRYGTEPAPAAAAAAQPRSPARVAAGN